MNKLSYSAINTYTTCGRKYQLRYKKNLRSKYHSGALVFGSAIDSSLNKLLLTKDLNQSKEEFDKQWSFQILNKVYTQLYDCTNLVYAETDFDEELLDSEDIVKLHNWIESPNSQVDYTLGYLELYNQILDEKKLKGWDNLKEDKKKFYNYCNWLSMRRKGYIMLESYNKEVLPRIQKVIEVQKEKFLKNSDEDIVVQYLDLIVQWEDGRILLMDNKTSAREYSEDSAGKSPQLISYYYGSKEDYKLDAVGFIVLYKTIIKNRKKKCSVCKNNGTGGRHKTCNAEINGIRCNGSWNETIKPECKIQIIINDVNENSESLVVETFDEANEGIKKEVYYKNLSACQIGNNKCEYYSYCWNKDESELIEVK